MRHLLVLAATVVLAACGSADSVNNSAAANGAAANMTAPAPAPANALPAADGNGTQAEGNAQTGPGGLTRPEMLAECTSQAEAMLPGVEPGPLCNCAVDRVLGGAQRRDAVRQCAAELNVRLPN